MQRSPELTAPLKNGLKPSLQAEARATNTGDLHHRRRETVY
jgi:hypothetical protein